MKIIMILITIIIRRVQRQVTVKEEPVDQPEDVDEDIRTDNNNDLESSSRFHDEGESERYEPRILNAREESILPDLDGDDSRPMPVLPAGKMKLSVKLEPAPQRMILEPRGVTVTPAEDIPEIIVPDTLEYTCEMCSAVFGSRAELLIHVPIHI